MRFALTQTIVLLVASNVFMTFAWYGHLKNFQGLPWWIAALASWGIALFEPGAVYFIFRGR
ncbi:MAG: DMT family protein [Cytophagaceae bacterium]|nr:DMT family protein [Gemmatimonadaceae bacterium]